jgi:hypothetical protein
MSIDSWDSELQQAGFCGVDVSTYDGKPPYHFYRNLIARISSEDHPQDSTIYLLGSTEVDPNSWQHEVEEILIRSGFTVKRCVIEDDIPYKQQVVSLLDLEGPFFVNISEQNWSAFQKLIKSSPRILWVTNSVELSCANPDFSLVMGISRTARQEQEVQFGTLQVDSFDTAAAESLLKVAGKFFKQPSESGLIDADYEFALHDGCIYIPRMQWSSLTDRLLLAPGLDAPVKLDIVSYGAIDSLCWKEAEIDSPGPNEVEVDIKFVGLNFRVRVYIHTFD